MRQSVLVVVVCLVATACDEGASRAAELQRVRPLGAQVRVASSQERSSPVAGEAVQVEWLVRGPEGRSAVHFVLGVCEAVGEGAALPNYTGPVFAHAQGQHTTPRLDFTVPADTRADELLVAGAFCESSPASFDEQHMLGACEDGALPESVSLHITLGESNLNPDLSRAELMLDAVAWPDGECPALLTDGATHVLGGRLPGAREQVGDSPERLEELLVAHVANRAGMARLLSIVDSSATEAVFEVPWTSAPSQGAGPVHFTFVVRDQRGGIAWLDRCATWAQP